MENFQFNLKLYFILIFTFLLVVEGCNTPDYPAVTARGDEQTAFRVRSDFSAELNADEGWVGDLNENVNVNTEEPFRIRFEVESTADTSQERRFHLQYRRNGEEWANVDAQKFPYPEREIELNFENDEVGEVPGGWRIVNGVGSEMNVVAGEEQPFLQVRAGEEPALGLGLQEVSWEPTEFAVAIRLPDQNQPGAGIIFGYVDPDNYCRVYLDAGGTVRVSRFADGEETDITEERITIVSDQWLNVEIEIEGNEAEVVFEDDALTFTADLGAAIPPSVPGYYIPANSAAEFLQFGIEGEAGTPRVSIIESETYDDGEQTRDLLEGSASAFIGGAGVSLSVDTVPIARENGHSEWEWPLVIRRFADGAVTNDAGDTFEFRMAYADGSPIATDVNPVVTVSVPPRLLGGTFVETPGRIGPWEASNGDLYFLMEPAETYNVLMAVKSTDGGETWEEVDGENRPITGDLEGFASDVSEGTIHMLHQTSDEVLHHAFHMSDHPTDPDTWAVCDDTVATPEEPPTQVASLTVRSDGSMVGVYGGPEKIHYKVRSTDGIWGKETVIDADAPPGVLSGPQTVLGKDDVVHLAYTGIGETDGTIWYRRVRPDGTLTAREQLASGVGTSEFDVGSVLPLAFIPETNTVVVIYRLASGKLWERRITDLSPPSGPVEVNYRNVVQNAVDSDQTGADVIADGTTVHVLFIEQDSGSIFHTYSNDSGTWRPATLLRDDIRGQWVRGMPLTRGSDDASVYGFVYDAGSNGGSGMNRYSEVPLEDL
jgi:hypothetical protein